MVKISSWGRLSEQEHEVRPLYDRQAIATILGKNRPGIAYGMGRSYGDVGLNPGGYLWLTTGLDRFISFDDQTGILTCEAGLMLRDIQRLTLPRGWLLPVTPGTQIVTVGGAIANDVHGKNHHVAGSFGNHVRHLTLIRTDGSVIECGPNLNPNWFAATVGGLGLTGIISQATIQLQHAAGPWLEAEIIPYANLDEFFRLADESEAGWQHTVSWIDCISNKDWRGIFIRANPAAHVTHPAPQKKSHSVPFTPPVSLVNKFSLRPFNALYFNIKQRRAGTSIVHYESFFYPLDSLYHWNRMYGPAGFYQYQCVVPRAGGDAVIKELLGEIARSDAGSFLSVLKTFGAYPSLGMLSFPQAGVTLALDFPNKGTETLELFTRLDTIVSAAGGRLYPAKDARMPREMFEAGYPRLHEFQNYRDPGISSALSRRLMGS